MRLQPAAPLGAAPRPHRVRRLRARRCGGAPGRATVPKESRFSPVFALSPAARAAEWRGCVKCASRGLAGRVRRRVARAGPPRSGAARERAVANVLLSVPVQQLPDTNGNGSGCVALVGPAMPGRRFSRSNLWTAFHEADLADPKLPRSGHMGRHDWRTSTSRLLHVQLGEFPDAAGSSSGMASRFHCRAAEYRLS